MSFPAGRRRRGRAVRKITVTLAALAAVGFMMPLTAAKAEGERVVIKEGGHHHPHYWHRDHHHQKVVVIKKHRRDY